MYENDLHLQAASLKRLLITLYFLLLLGALAGSVQAKTYSEYESRSKISGVTMTEPTAVCIIQCGESAAFKSNIVVPIPNFFIQPVKHSCSNGL